MSEFSQTVPELVALPVFVPDFVCPVDDGSNGIYQAEIGQAGHSGSSVLRLDGIAVSHLKTGL